jgi:hypothetical protein
MANEFRQRALQNGQLSAGITAVKEIGVLTGSGSSDPRSAQLDW